MNMHLLDRLTAKAASSQLPILSWPSSTLLRDNFTHHHFHYYSFIAYCTHRSNWIYKPREN